MWSERSNRFAYLAILAVLLFVLVPSPGQFSAMALLVVVVMILPFLAYAASSRRRGRV